MLRGKTVFNKKYHGLPYNYQSNEQVTETIKKPTLLESLLNYGKTLWNSITKPCREIENPQKGGLSTPEVHNPHEFKSSS